MTDDRLMQSDFLSVGHPPERASSPTDVVLSGVVASHNRYMGDLPSVQDANYHERLPIVGAEPTILVKWRRLRWLTKYHLTNSQPVLGRSRTYLTSDL